MEKLRVIFIIPNEYADEQECSELMCSAFQACKANSIKAEWVKDNSKISDSNLKKTDIVVFEKFEGDQFDRLKNTKTILVGARCFFVCLIEGREIPNLNWPIFNMAMSDCVITVSHTSKREKGEFQEKIKLMGGKYTDGLFDGNTHVITDSVKSEKYIKAAEMGLKLMLPNWVDAVWETSKTTTVHCNDEEFKKFHCPPFHKLVISTTGIHHKEEREKMKRIIAENGGTYMGQLNTRTVDVLLCGSTLSTPKIQAAKNSKRVKCVSYGWLADSVRAGYALKDTDYSIKPSTSTPTKEDEDGVDPNFSTISNIPSNMSEMQKSVFQETASIISFKDTTNVNNNPPRKRKSSSLDDISDMIDSIDIKVVKKAGSFLDGCCVYLAGFTADQREKLSRVLNLGGATRYDQLSDRITHVIVGDQTQCDVREFKKQHGAPIVSLQWLNDCVRHQRVIDEEDYLVSLQVKSSAPPQDTNSPITQKDLKLLRRELSKEVRSNAEEISNDSTICEAFEGITDIDNDIMQQYLKPNKSSEEDTLAQLLQNHQFSTNQIENPADNPNTEQRLDSNSQTSTKAIVNANLDTDSTNASLSETESEITRNYNYNQVKFLILRFAEDQATPLRDNIESYGGQVYCINCDSSFNRNIGSIPLTQISYIIVPAFAENILQILEECDKIVESAGEDAKIEIVTDLFVSDCYQKQEIAPIDYYHRPVPIPSEFEEVGPLRGFVVTISSYTGIERVFLNCLITKLGGLSQEQFSRVRKGGLSASTHLVNPQPTGKKYEAAIRWGLPVVTKDWLMECAKKKRPVPEEKYLVGDAKAPFREQSNETSEEPVNNEEPSNRVEVSRKLMFDDSARTAAPQHVEEHHENSSAKENQDSNIQGAETLKNQSDLESADRKTLNTTNRSVNTPGTSKYFPKSGILDLTPLTARKRSNLDSPRASGSITPRSQVRKRFGSNPKTTSPSKSTPEPLKAIKKTNVNSPQCSSQVTPVSEIMKRFGMDNMMSSSALSSPSGVLTPDARADFSDISTPDTPYGAFLRPNPSPALRKECKKWLNRFPKQTPKPPRKPQTPFSELKRRLWNKITHENYDTPNESDKPSASSSSEEDNSDEGNAESNENLQPDIAKTPRTNIDHKIQHLQELMSSCGTKPLFRKSASRGAPESCDMVAPVAVSQSPDVQWHDEGSSKKDQILTQQEKLFIITSIENNEKDIIVKRIQELGSKVCDLHQYDGKGTHLIAPKPQRTEKILSSMAAGKWILHPSYISKSSEAGRFLEEDLFEFGNPKANDDISADCKNSKSLNPNALHYWRVEINKRGYGAFHDMKAIIISSKKDPIMRIIEAGGGMVIDAKPPFEEVYATHCLIDPKSCPDLMPYVPLAKQGIFCVNVSYISDFLYKNVENVRSAILPDLVRYYMD